MTHGFDTGFLVAFEVTDHPEVAVPEESPSESVRQARAVYLRGKENQKR
jgi:hypothetical protein